MPSLPTVEIHSPKDASQKWVINQDDYDASKHTLWGELAQPQQEAVVHSREVVLAPAPVMDTESLPVYSGMRPSVPDYVHDDNGDIVAVTIINPNQRNARLEIPYSDFDPDIHELWSSHPRFNH